MKFVMSLRKFNIVSFFKLIFVVFIFLLYKHCLR